MPDPREQMVTRPEELPEVCAHIAACPRFGFDTEFVGEDTYRPELCLIQVATPERLILIDPFTVGPLDAFWELVVDPARQVVVHAGREEIRLCHLWTGRRPGNLFDLQLAAGLVGLTYPIGHAPLVGQLLRISLAKSETLTEWRDRPLTEKQLHYAFDDVRYLLPLWQELSGRLERHGRLAWAEEEFHRLAAMVLDEGPAVERWRKLKGLGSLGRRQLAVVRELYQWRAAAAERHNRPPRTICRDDLLIEIARRGPTRERDLRVIRGLAHRDLTAILAAVEHARALPVQDWPEAAAREQDPPQVQWLTSLLSAVLGQLCSEAELAPTLAGTTADLRLLVRSYVYGGARNGASLLDEGWRAAHVRPPLEAVLRGEQAVRVARPEGDAPLEFRPREG